MFTVMYMYSFKLVVFKKLISGQSVHYVIESSLGY